MFGVVAGIETDGPGYKRIIIRPQPGGGFSYAKASYESIHGMIESFGKKEGDVFALDVTVPPNTKATVYFLPKVPAVLPKAGCLRGLAREFGSCAWKPTGRYTRLVQGIINSSPGLKLKKRQ